MEPGTSSLRIGIKFNAPVSKNISCIPVTMPFESGRKRSENERTSLKLATCLLDKNIYFLRKSKEDSIESTNKHYEISN